MRKLLVCHPESAASERLQADLKPHGWALDVCDGLLEMLRLIEANQYDTIIVDVNHLNVDIFALLGAIDALQRSPEILFNVPRFADELPPAVLALDYPMIKGALTMEKLLQVASGPR